MRSVSFPPRIWRVVVAASALCGLVPVDASAQAWTARKGSLTYTVGYANSWNTKHYLSDGEEVDLGHTRSQTVALGVSFAATDRLTLAAGLPFVRARYSGSAPHPGTVDDGQYHGALQDLRLELRYQLFESSWALTPFVSTAQPTNDYSTLGHAAVGRGVEEYAVGFYAGQSLDRWIPRTYHQLRYGYTFAEKVGGVSHDRSNADLELGYFFTDRFGGRALVSWQETYGGITLPIAPTDPLFRYHDQAAAAAHVNLGVGLSYSLGPRVDVYGLYARSVRGRNDHKLDDGLSLGVSFSLDKVLRDAGEAAGRGEDPTSTYERPPRPDDGRTTTREELGLSRQPLDEMTEALLRDEYPNVHAVLIAKDGRLVYEEYFIGPASEIRRGR